MSHQQQLLQRALPASAWCLVFALLGLVGWGGWGAQHAGVAVLVWMLSQPGGLVALCSTVPLERFRGALPFMSLICVSAAVQWLSCFVSGGIHAATWAAAQKVPPVAAACLGVGQMLGGMGAYLSLLLQVLPVLKAAGLCTHVGQEKKNGHAAVNGQCHMLWCACTVHVILHSFLYKNCGFLVCLVIIIMDQAVGGQGVADLSGVLYRNGSLCPC